ncbi:MAG: SAM-dependent chlorinase/fluorinase [Chitinophagales bacterium]|nr:SAM-dependent chlorinase/fluorinase [Chitinophagales bacterium]MCZ2393313.1 SAM-dependent chlorinase/fluorinase [Chitinophagales bacterium]
MPIVTLTTDFGHSDIYSGRFKGHILSLNKDVNIIDITHQIPPYNVAIGAYSLKYTFSSFPKGTIHIIRVDEKDLDKSRLLIAFCKGHFFIAPDNGLLPLALGHNMDWVRVVDLVKLGVYSANETYSKLLSHILNNEYLDYSEESKDYIVKTEWVAIKEADSIIGMVVLVDYFGNLLTNIHFKDIKPYIERYNDITIIYRHNENIKGLVTSYDDVKNGEAMCRINDLGFLEIAVNRGSAASYLGIKFGHQVKILFE